MLRFAFALLPAALFIRRPPVPWRPLRRLRRADRRRPVRAAVPGDATADISPGLASLVVQTQVFFTIGLAMRAGRRAGARVPVARAGAGGRRASA
ncbi:MAG: hypothetical protein MZW92_66640 [Comamonadaceae bacterium]|nr:hypothetical protein [Comamonadaceae bacterium]